mgnify:CR=1 FL=1
MILPRYFIRETIKIAAAIVGGLLVLYLTMRLAAALGDAAEGEDPRALHARQGHAGVDRRGDLLARHGLPGSKLRALRLDYGNHFRPRRNEINH